MARGHIATPSDVDTAVLIGFPKTDARDQQIYKCGDCNKKQPADAAQPLIPEHVKRRAVRLCIESVSMSEARVVGASVTSVRYWLGGGALELMREMSVRRTSGRAAPITAPTIALRNVDIRGR